MFALKFVESITYNTIILWYSIISCLWTILIRSLVFGMLNRSHLSKTQHYILWNRIVECTNATIFTRDCSNLDLKNKVSQSFRPPSSPSLSTPKLTAIIRDVVYLKDHASTAVLHGNKSNLNIFCLSSRIIQIQYVHTPSYCAEVTTSELCQKYF